MSLSRSSTDNYSVETLTNTVADNSSSALASTRPLDQGNSTSPISRIGDEEPPIPVPIHTLSRPSDWVRLLHSILFTQGQNSILAWLSLLYIVARLPLAVLSIYQIYRFAISSTAEGLAIMIVMFLMWILEKEIGLEKMCWDALVGMGEVQIAMERGKRNRELKRLKRWEERLRFEREERQREWKRERERDGRDWDGRNGDGGVENDGLEPWIQETSMLRDDDRLFYEGEGSDTTKLL